MSYKDHQGFVSLEVSTVGIEISKNYLDLTLRNK